MIRNLKDIAQQNARDNKTLNDAQALIDDALELAALIVHERDFNDHTGAPRRARASRIVNIAEGIISQQRFVELASYLLDPAVDGHKRSRSGLLRSVSNWGALDG